MTLAYLARRLWALERRRLALAALLTALVPLTGLSLLGLSGWFVAASAVAGLTGLGLVFDFFRPAAAIRLLSPARAAARYGERLIGHDATLRALNVLRGGLFAGLLARPAAEQMRLRSAEGLNRLSADLDAVEGVAIRLILPLIATLIVLPVGLGVIVWLVGWAAGLAAGALHLAAVPGLLALSGPRLAQAAAAEESAAQALRAETAEALRLRSLAALAGALPGLAGRIEAAARATEAARARLDAAERWAGAVLTLAPMLAAACVLVLGQAAGPARLLGAALVALALAEAPRSLWRGLAERGRIKTALARWPAPAAAPAPRPAPQPVAEAPPLALDAVVAAPPGGGRALFAPIDLTLQRGEWAGLVAPSGSGKSSLLLAIAGLAPLLNGQVRLLGHPLDDWPEAEMRQHLTLVPQRPALIGGTVAENLALGAPDAAAEECEAALRTVALWDVLAPRGGLSARLGARGAGLSGGEARRLALARAVLRRPTVLLLDEPTEGLDAATAAAVLDGLRRALPDAAVLIASHRAADVAGLGQIVHPMRFPGAPRAQA